MSNIPIPAICKYPNPSPTKEQVTEKENIKISNTRMRLKLESCNKKIT